MHRLLTPSITSRVDTPAARTVGLALYYASILLALLVIYGMGEVNPSSFVYQGF
jgi:hypothetical protein